jgi:hypothetical protein
MRKKKVAGYMMKDCKRNEDIRGEMVRTDINTIKELTNVRVKHVGGMP